MADTLLKGRKLETRMCYSNPDENNDGHLMNQLRNQNQISQNYKLFTRNTRKITQLTYLLFITTLILCMIRCFLVVEIPKVHIVKLPTQDVVTMK